MWQLRLIKIVFFWVAFIQCFQEVISSTTTSYTGATDVPTSGYNHCNGNVQFDLYYLQENTASFSDDVSALVWELPLALEHIADKYPGSRLGLGFFKDKNSSSVGVHPTDYGYEFKHILGLSNDYQKFQETIRTTFWPRKGDDESPQDGFRAMIFGALHVAAAAPPASIYDSDNPIMRVRIVLLITDNIAYLEDESVAVPRQWDLRTGYGALYGTSPTFSETKKILRDNKIVPIVLTTENNFAFWRHHVSRLSSAGIVAGLADNSSNLSEAIATVLDRVACFPKSVLPGMDQPSPSASAKPLPMLRPNEVTITETASYEPSVTKPTTTSMMPTNLFPATVPSISITTTPLSSTVPKPQRIFLRAIVAKPAITTDKTNPSTFAPEVAIPDADTFLFKPITTTPNPTTPTTVPITTTSRPTTTISTANGSGTKIKQYTTAPTIPPATLTTSITEAHTIKTKLVSMKAQLPITTAKPTPIASQLTVTTDVHTTPPLGVISPTLVTSSKTTTATELLTISNTRQFLTTPLITNSYEKSYIHVIAASGGAVVIGTAIAIGIIIRKKHRKEASIEAIQFESLTFSEDSEEKEVCHTIENGDFFTANHSILPQNTPVRLTVHK